MAGLGKDGQVVATSAGLNGANQCVVTATSVLMTTADFDAKACIL